MTQYDNDPVWKPSLLPSNVPTMINFDNPIPVTGGTSQYGDWELYKVTVTNQKVVKDKTEIIEGYTGNAVWFLNKSGKKKDKEGKEISYTPKLYTSINNSLIKGELNFMITKTPVEKTDGTGYFTVYEVTDLEGKEL